ncbi:MAG: translation initiation factor IF-3 [Clostridia bacterium]|nr:translation initiation factor IF-3 [Clostridia bacterium]
MINEQIKFKEVRVVGENGEQLGVMSSESALHKAYDAGLDLVVMAANAVPPVCRIIDYGKYRFEREKKEKESRRKQQITEVKEIQLSCRIENHDFETKANRAVDFLKRGDKVKAIVKFRGREMGHTEFGRELLGRLAEYCSEYATVDKNMNLEGRFMTMLLSPIKAGTSKTDKAEKNSKPAAEAAKNAE